MFRGRSLDGLRPQAIVHAGIARSFQNLRLFLELSALDNVMVALPRQFAEEPLGAIFRPLHAGRRQRRRRDEALAALQHVGLGDRADDTVRNLSYGEQKLLTVARLLATGAELLLLDEPSIGLAPNLVERMFRQVQEVCRSRAMTAILVEQNVAASLQIADRVVIMNNGQTVFDGLPDEARASNFWHFFCSWVRLGRPV